MVGFSRHQIAFHPLPMTVALSPLPIKFTKWG
jgi:hypothetical protein